jgi:hypothetical protein
MSIHFKIPLFVFLKLNVKRRFSFNEHIANLFKVDIVKLQFVHAIAFTNLHLYVIGCIKNALDKLAIQSLLFFLNTPAFKPKSAEANCRWFMQKASDTQIIELIQKEKR